MIIRSPTMTIGSPEPMTDKSMPDDSPTALDAREIEAIVTKLLQARATRQPFSLPVAVGQRRGTASGRRQRGHGTSTRRPGPVCRRACRVGAWHGGRRDRQYRYLDHTLPG